MNERELLERAAKAAGMELVLWHADGTPHAARPGDTVSFRWNPLTDDGDALRLAVKLGFCVGKAVQAPQRFAYPQTTDDAFYEEENGDPYAATRLAIVRAAAALAGDGSGR